MRSTKNINLVKKHWIGKSVGKLTIIDVKLKRNKYTFYCKCSCGKYCEKTHTSLLGSRHRLSASCGCSMYQYACGNKNYLWKGYGEISSKLWTRYKAGAKIRNIEFSIPIKAAWELFLSQNRRCKLCGEYLIFGESDKNHASTTASLDRIDPNKPYIKGNLQWVHKIINEMRWDLTTTRFLHLCYLIKNPLQNDLPNEEIYKHVDNKSFRGIGALPLDRFSIYKRNADKRKIKFLISINDAWDIFLQQRGYCSITGLPLVFGNYIKKTTASLDRINNNKGYTTDNIQWVHKDINSKIRKSLSREDLFYWALKVINYYGRSHES